MFIYGRVPNYTEDNRLEGIASPNKGFKSFTVREEIYNYWQERFLKDKDKMMRETGHTSFTAYMTKRLFDMKDIDEKIERLFTEHGDELRKRGIYTIPALLEEAFRQLEPAQAKKLRA